MPRKKKSGLKGQLPLPFEKPDRVRRRPVYSAKSLERAKELMALRKQASDLSRLLRSDSRVISKIPKLYSDPDVERGLRSIDAFLRELNKSHGPGFHVSKAREQEVSMALRLIDAKWGHVLADARTEMGEKKKLNHNQREPRLI